MRLSRLSRYAGIALGTALAMGCGNGVTTNKAIQDRVALESFESCSSLEQYIEDTAVLDMRATLEQYKNGSGGIFFFGGGMAEDARTEGAAASTSGPSAYTTTNTQVAGVDEADFVKNDGTRIFLLSGNKLYINRSWPAAELQTLSSVQIEGYPREMYLDERDHVVIFSSVYTPLPTDPAGIRSCGSGMRCGYSYSNTMKITVVDVADLTAPQVVTEYFLPGYYTSSRRIGDSVRLVMGDYFRWPTEVRWWVNSGTGMYNDRAALGRAYDVLMADNERLIRSQPLDAWLPKAYYRTADGSFAQVGYDCTEFHKSNAPAKLGFVSLATLDLSPNTLATVGHPTVHRTTVLAQPGEIYASATSLYVASHHWWWWPEPGQKDYTYLHKFDITHPSQALYVGSGGVSGHIVDQFSMDEHDGFFRVATTTATRVPDLQNSWGRLETTNAVYVLAEDSGTLKVVGQTEELAKGERIYSSRFMGTKGFVTTFRQMDPLFTFDLSDPVNPRRVGELHVPGFSTYLHPIDQDHLLAIGEYVPETQPVDWRARRLQLSIFDVSDFANPRQTFTQTVGTAYSWSEAAYEHKAFNYFPERKLLAIPFFDWTTSGTWSWNSFTSDLRVFSVDAETGFTPRGAVTMRDVYQSSNFNNWSYYWTPYIRRSVMADDFVYAISDSGIRVANVNSLSTPLATVTFNPYRE
jgi:uncharacterized secreted protein with C-terminal beta-propeller domain